MATPLVMAIGKETSKSIIFNDSPLTGVNTPGCDENSMKLICFDVHLVTWCCKEWRFHVYDDHWDSTDDDSLLMLLSLQSSRYERSIKNLELNHVKFKIRGGLLGILELSVLLLILLLNTAAAFKTLLLVISYCCLKDWFCWRYETAED